MGTLHSNVSSVISAGDGIELTFTATEGAYLSITIEATASGSGGHIIQDDDTPLAARAALSFQDGFVVTDDAGGDQTELDLSYGTTPTDQDYSDVAAAGTSIKVAREDHLHGMPAAGSGAPADADYLVGTATGDLSAEIVVGTSPGGELGGTWGSPTVDATHSGSTHSTATDAHIADVTDVHDHGSLAGLTDDDHTQYLKEADFDDVDFLVGTATGHTGAEIVVGTSPGGELGGTWASPTVDATHSGSTHGAAVTTHEAAGDPHTGYRLESADHTHQSTGAQAGTLDHGAALTGLTDDDHPQYRKETDLIHLVTFSKAGNLSTGTGAHRWYNDTGVTITMASARGSVGTAPATQSILIDVNISGTSAWAATQANRITIAAAGNTDEGGAFDDATIADGEYLTVDIDQVGTGTVGADLTVSIWGTHA